MFSRESKNIGKEMLARCSNVKCEYGWKFAVLFLFKSRLLKVYFFSFSFGFSVLHELIISKFNCLTTYYAEGKGAKKVWGSGYGKCCLSLFKRESNW